MIKLIKEDKEMIFDDVYTEEYLDELLEGTIRAAGIIYETNATNLHDYIERDDFIQEACLHIYDLFERRYIKPKEDIYETPYNLVFTLISGTFLYNQFNTVNRDEYNRTLKMHDANEEHNEVQFTAGQPEIKGEFVKSSYLDPSEKYDYDSKMTRGKDLLITIADNVLKTRPIRGRVHTYEGYIKELGGHVELSEIIVGLALIEGYSVPEIVTLFGQDNTDNSSKTIQVYTYGYRVRDKLKKAVAQLNKEDQELVKFYLEEYGNI